MCAETLEDEARVRNRHGNGLGSAGEKEKEREMRWQFWGSGWIPASIGPRRRLDTLRRDRGGWREVSAFADGRNRFGNINQSRNELLTDPSGKTMRPHIDKEEPALCCLGLWLAVIAEADSP